ncbi:heterokaryon incompatibility protein-domain-containing protein [Lophiotrema nucula]|uniref:Heterokaryon incompatibility protein-domain-containing protein n=1 Tax=Lophiotrema nucula TaxID=690887 RepID=A0A6A5ZTX1_9PLEO|nr:heterokaryon incompatibility protein-domain-containing protein [Lophiotrema nucula]
MHLHMKPECPVCIDLNAMGHIAIRVHSSIQDLRRSVEHGCPGCEAILDALFACLPEVLGHDTEDIQILPSGDDGTARFSVKWRDHMIELFELPALPEEFPHLEAAYFLSGDTSQECHFQRALTWLRECTENYVHCNQGDHFQALGAKFSKRLVDVTPVDEVGSVKLLELTQVVGPYLCLSHCWGSSSHPLRTLKENLSQHLASIDWDSLPATFKDAIHFTRRLGYQFVWIDSLCIVQDDLDDWREQAAQMANIFQN